jgi:hypothetical protein
MRGCAWLTGIDRHALHVPCTSRLGSLAKPYLRWSLQGPGAFTLVIFGIGFVTQHKEYLGTFESWLKDHGIRHQTSAAHKLQQNGRAERINRTLIEKTRALLMEKDLPKELWAAAIQAAAHIHNATPAARQEMTPHQMFNGKPADTSRLRVFGCLAYSLTPTAQRKKSDARSEPGLFIGYAEGSKAWRILRLHKGKAAVVETANVRFVEDSQPYFEQGRLRRQQLGR